MFEFVVYWNWNQLAWQLGAADYDGLDMMDPNSLGRFISIHLSCIFDHKIAQQLIWHPCSAGSSVGMVEICAKILQIMRNNFKDYAHTFCQLCAPFSALYYT